MDEARSLRPSGRVTCQVVSSRGQPGTIPFSCARNHMALLSMKRKRDDFTDSQIRDAYDQAGSLAGLAKALGVSYPTSYSWASALGIKKKRQGYTAPNHPITGAQCRHAREYLGMTRDEFCYASGVGKTALRQFELGNSFPRRGTMEKIIALFQRNQVVFLPDGTFSKSS